VGTTVQDDFGRTVGVVIINLFAEKMLGTLARLDHSLSSRVLLVGEAGCFVEMVEDKGAPRYRAGTPEELGDLRQIGIGRPSEGDNVEVGTAGDLIHAKAPVHAGAGKHWDLIKIYSRKELFSEIAALRREIFALTLPLVILAVVLAIITAKIFQRADARITESEDLRRNERLLILQGRQEAMGEIVSSIAHQWRQPLNTLGLIIQEISFTNDSNELRCKWLSEKTLKAMELIQYMSKTIDDFMGFFKSDKEMVSFVVNQVIARTLSLFEKNFKCSGISMHIEGEDNLVATSHPNEYGQALLNILMNARDALVERKVPDACIVLHFFKTEGQRVVVTVADNAGGIDEKIIDKVFDPYFTTKGPDRGTGIGLYMAKTIIEKNMGGHLTVCNTAEGAEFRIEI